MQQVQHYDTGVVMATLTGTTARTLALHEPLMRRQLQDACSDHAQGRLRSYMQCVLLTSPTPFSCNLARELMMCPDRVALHRAPPVTRRNRDCFRGLVIDATVKGGPARYINHSCDANCETQKWIVRGETRVGIYALRTIRPGQEITYNYNLEWNGFARIRCALQLNLTAAAMSTVVL
jgi:hypothetical protein